MSSSHLPINLFHILVVAPFLLYVAFVRGQLMPWVFQVLVGLGIVILVYHLYSLMKKIHAQSPSAWINAIHVIAVAPLLLFIGIKSYDTPRWAYEILAIFAFGALGYNLYSMALSIQEMAGPSKV